MICLIDNYDSFTYNIVTYCHQLGYEPVVYKNDELSLLELQTLPIQGIILSPGPGTPHDSGITLDVIRAYADKVPIFGICLGHECIGEVYGASIQHAHKVMHGKISTIQHDGEGIFNGVPDPINVARYHSLIIDAQTLPNDFVVSAWSDCEDGQPEIMAMRHKTLPLESVQFHPESILTDYGHLMMANFLRRCR